MTDDQADYVLARMCVVWAGKPLTVEEVNFWVSKLQPYEFEHGMDALEKIADHCKFFPSWAEYKEFIDLIKRNNPVNVLEKPEEKPVCSQEESEHHLKRIRETLAKNRGGIG